MAQNVMVIGLGYMGAALAHTLINNSYSVTVWNRTAAKAEPLVNAGADFSESVETGVAANEIIVLCLSTYQDCYEVLEECVDLTGKTIIQLTTASVDQAQEMASWAKDRKADYLDGAIIAYPSGVGSGASMLIMGGDLTAWERCEAIVKTLGPASRYMGTDVAIPASLDFAMIFVGLVSQLAVIQGYHLLEDSDLSADAYADFVAPLFSQGVGAGLRKTLAAIEQDDFTRVEASIKTWSTAISHAGDTGSVSKNTALIDAVQAMLRGAIDAGEGDRGLDSMIRYMRQSRAR